MLALARLPGLDHESQPGSIVIALEHRERDGDLADRIGLVDRHHSAQRSGTEDNGTRERLNNLAPMILLIWIGHRRVLRHLVDAVGGPVLPDVWALAEQ